MNLLFCILGLFTSLWTILTYITCLCFKVHVYYRVKATGMLKEYNSIRYLYHFTTQKLGHFYQIALFRTLSKPSFPCQGI